MQCLAPLQSHLLAHRKCPCFVPDPPVCCQRATVDEPKIHKMLAERLQAKFSRDFNTADRIRDELKGIGIEVYDKEKSWKATYAAGGGFGGGGGGGGGYAAPAAASYGGGSSSYGGGGRDDDRGRERRRSRSRSRSR